MQHIVLIINIYLTFITSTILPTFREIYKVYGHFRTKIQYVHFFQITIGMVVWGTIKVYR